jgi:hypothetical protein
MPSIEQEVKDILDPGIEGIEDQKHPDIGDAMNMLGRAVAAIEHLSRRLDEINDRMPRTGAPV